VESGFVEADRQVGRQGTMMRETRARMVTDTGRQAGNHDERYKRTHMVTGEEMGRKISKFDLQSSGGGKSEQDNEVSHAVSEFSGM
jgi:hypothetical protein